MTVLNCQQGMLEMPPCPSSYLWKVLVDTLQPLLVLHLQRLVQLKVPMLPPYGLALSCEALSL